MKKKYKKIYVEITNACNLACDFCPQTKRRPQFMEIGTFSCILNQIKPYTDYIYLHVKGEPLFHPNIDLLLDLAYENAFKVNITTNGTLVSKVKDKLLSKPAIRQINFSLHSIEGNKDYVGEDRYLDDIFEFIREAKDKTTMIIALRLWNLESSGTGLKDNTDYTMVTRETDYTETKENKNNGLLRRLEQEFNLDYTIGEKLMSEGGIKLSDRVYLNQDYKFQWPDLQEMEDDGAGFCYALRDQAAILVDGTVVPCCLDGEGVINLGNILEDSFSSIINSPRAQSIYQGFSERKAVEELCRKCGYRRKFNI